MQLIVKRKNINQRDAQSTFNIDDGAVITENYNETLDSATIRISQIPNYVIFRGRRVVVNQLLFDLEPYDVVILHDDNEEPRFTDKYMCVDTITKTMENLEDYGTTYTFEISLFSETKTLENIPLPNLSITQLADGSHRSVWYYLTQYLNIYGPKIRRQYSGYTGFVSKYGWTQNSTANHPLPSSRFNIDCPEMMWNNPTLREVLTDLMMVADCIPVVRNGKIDYIDLTKKYNDISNNEHINYIQNSQSSEDYISELKMDMQNVMQTSVSGVLNSCNRIENLTFRAESDSYVITEDNVCLTTQYPIANIKHLWMIFQYSVELSDGIGGKTLTIKVDLCNLPLTGGQIKNLVYEQTEYKTLPLKATVPTDFSVIYQNIAIYFTRGSNIISGFNNKSKDEWWNFHVSKSMIGTLKDLIVNNCKVSNNRVTNSVRPTYDTQWFSTWFQIEYETSCDTVFQAGKDIHPSNERVIIDNQTNSYVDAYNQGFMEYQKANRLGNQQLHINARYYEDYENIIKIGDYYNDSIVFQTQYQIYNDHIEVNAIATKSYILKDYFTGVKAKIRSWKIATGEEALIRNDLNKYYLEFSFNQKIEAILLNFIIGDIGTLDYFLSSLYSDEVQPLRFCVCYTTATNSSYPNQNLTEDRFCSDLVSRIIGNSLVFTFGFEDNFQFDTNILNNIEDSDSNLHVYNQGPSGSYLLVAVDTSYEDDYGGIPLEPLQYVDNNGEFENIVYEFVLSVENSNLSKYNPTEEQLREFMLSSCKRPLVDYNEVGTTIIGDGLLLYKDNREITKLSTQFEFCSDTHNIIFTRKFLELQECVRNTDEMFTDNDLYQSMTGEVISTSTRIIGQAIIPHGLEKIRDISYQMTGEGSEYLTQYSANVADISENQTAIVEELTFSQPVDASKLTFNVSYYLKRKKLSLKLRVGNKSNFDYKNPSISGTTIIGDETNIIVGSETDDRTGFVELQNLPSETNVSNSAFYITFIDNSNNEYLLLAFTGHNKIYLNLLKSRNYNIYDTDGNVIDEI